MRFVYLYILRINSDYEIFDLLRCYAAYNGIWLQFGNHTNSDYFSEEH